MKANACSGGSLWVPSLSAIKMSNLLTSNGKTNLYAQIFKNLAKQTLNRLKHRHTHTHTHTHTFTVWRKQTAMVRLFLKLLGLPQSKFLQLEFKNKNFHYPCEDLLGDGNTGCVWRVELSQGFMQRS